jgi:lipopolysaccharide biosynthesis glycosyltransferase
MDKTHPLVLVMEADEDFALPAAVALFSALKNCVTTRGVEIFLFDAGLGNRSRKRIAALVDSFSCRLHWRASPDLSDEKLPASKRLGTRGYIKILLPRLLPPDREKALFVDADILVEGNIAELFEEDVSGHPLGAIQNVHQLPPDGVFHLSRLPGLGIEEGEGYFNAGILLLNLAQMRREQTHERALELLRKYEKWIKYPTQDGLNLACRGLWKNLPQRWNQQPRSLAGQSYRHIPHGILHFTGRRKPWSAKHTSHRHDDIGRAHAAFRREMRRCPFLGPGEKALFSAHQLAHRFRRRLPF